MKCIVVGRMKEDFGAVVTCECPSATTQLPIGLSEFMGQP